MPSISPDTELVLPFALQRASTPVRRPTADRLFAGVVGRACGALHRMAAGARQRGVVRADREVPTMTVFGDLDAVIARARVVADRRAAAVAPAVVGCCPDCLADVGPSKFCPECGLALVPARSCRMCEAELPGGSRFCLECGAQD
jgi:hypothetical protein